MFKKNLLRLAAILGFFAILTVTAMSSHVSAQACDTVTDVQLVAAIYAKIKADKALAPQVSHINIVAINRAVKLQGWTDTRKDYDKVLQFVSEINCIRLVNLNIFEPVPPPPDSPMRIISGGCAAGTKRCGDVCIPEGDSCGITNEAGE